MSLLSTFQSDLNAVVVGASGGIGAAFVRSIGNSATQANIRSFSRSGRSEDSPKGEHIDITDERSVAQAAEKAASAGPFDLVLVATGLLHDGDFRPEKTMRELTPDAMATAFAVNTIGPALVAKHFLPNMRRGSKSVFAALSARVGSISDNRLGGWTSYRASKAALNMVLKTLSIEHARRFPESIIVALHPGTVDTNLSAPFQGNVPDGKLFTSDYSAQQLLGVINGLEPQDTGGFFAWDGQPVSF